MATAQMLLIEFDTMEAGNASGSLASETLAALALAWIASLQSEQADLKRTLQLDAKLSELAVWTSCQTSASLAHAASVSR